MDFSELNSNDLGMLLYLCSDYYVDDNILRYTELLAYKNINTHFVENIIMELTRKKIITFKRQEEIDDDEDSIGPKIVTDYEINIPPLVELLRVTSVQGKSFIKKVVNQYTDASGISLHEFADELVNGSIVLLLNGLSIVLNRNRVESRVKPKKYIELDITKNLINTIQKFICVTNISRVHSLTVKFYFELYSYKSIENKESKFTSSIIRKLNSEYDHLTKYNLIQNYYCDTKDYRLDVFKYLDDIMSVFDDFIPHPALISDFELSNDMRIKLKELSWISF